MTAAHSRFNLSCYTALPESRPNLLGSSLLSWLIDFVFISLVFRPQKIVSNLWPTATFRGPISPNVFHGDVGFGGMPEWRGRVWSGPNAPRNTRPQRAMRSIRSTNVADRKRKRGKFGLMIRPNGRAPSKINLGEAPSEWKVESIDNRVPRHGVVGRSGPRHFFGGGLFFLLMNLG